MAKSKTNRIYRDGKRIASEPQINKVKPLILKDAAEQRVLGNSPIYTVHRKGQIHKKCRVINRRIAWLKSE